MHSGPLQAENNTLVLEPLNLYHEYKVPITKECFTKQDSVSKECLGDLDANEYQGTVSKKQFNCLVQKTQNLKNVPSGGCSALVSASINDFNAQQKVLSQSQYSIFNKSGTAQQFRSACGGSVHKKCPGLEEHLGSKDDDHAFQGYTCLWRQVNAVQGIKPSAPNAGGQVSSQDLLSSFAASGLSNDCESFMIRQKHANLRMGVPASHHLRAHPVANLEPFASKPIRKIAKLNSKVKNGTLPSVGKRIPASAPTVAPISAMVVSKSKPTVTAEPITNKARMMKYRQADSKMPAGATAQ